MTLSIGKPTITINVPPNNSRSKDNNEVLKFGQSI